MTRQQRIRIRCMTDHMHLPSLGKRLNRGQELVLLGTEFNHPEIQQALRFRAIEVCEMSRRPKIKSVQKHQKSKQQQVRLPGGKRINKPFARIQKESTQRATVTGRNQPQTQDNSRSQQVEISAQVLSSLTDTIVNRVVSALESKITSMQTNSSLPTKNVGTHLPSSRQTTMASQVREVVDDFIATPEPIFIPKGIVNEEMQGEVQLNTTVEENGNLDSVAEALRNLRKK